MLGKCMKVLLITLCRSDILLFSTNLNSSGEKREGITKSGMLFRTCRM